MDDQAVSASFNLPVAELKQRLQGFIRSFPTSMELPGLSGMLGIEAPETKEKGASVRAIALRCGAGVLPTTSWAVVRVLKEKSLLTSAGCECPSRDDVREESKMAFDRMVAAIGAAPSTPLKRPVHPEHLPAFTPDAPPDVDWSDVGILRLLRQSLRTRGNFPAGGSSSTGKNRVLGQLTEEELLDRSDPVLVYGEVRPPKLITKVQPVYPEDARRNRVEGKVVLEVIVDTDGTVSDLRVLRSIPALNQAALEAVCGWRYNAATLGGKPVRVFFTVVVDFTLPK